MKKVYCYLKAGRGRPDGQDAKEIIAFAKKVLEKLESGSDRPGGNCAVSSACYFYQPGFT